MKTRRLGRCCLSAICALMLALQLSVVVAAAEIEVGTGLSDEGYEAVASPRVTPYAYPTANLSSASYNAWNPYKNIAWSTGCTRYAWGRANERRNLSLPSWGNAVNWYDNARNAGYSVGATPRAHSIAVWSGGYGHVAYIEGVDNTHVYLTEGGWTGSNGGYGGNKNCHDQYYPISGMSNRYGKILKGYIYLPENDTTPPSITNFRVSGYHGGGYSLICNVTDASGVSVVKFLARSQSTGKEIWHTGRHAGDTTYVCDINLSDFDYATGGYTNEAWAMDNKSNTTTSLPQVQANVSAGPVISNVKVTDVCSAGYKVSCTVTVPAGQSVDRVQFPSWTLAGGQDDLKSDWWSNPSYSGTKNGNTYTFYVRDKDHNFEKGEYLTHIYAIDGRGVSTSLGLNKVMVKNTLTPRREWTYKGVKYLVFDDNLTWDQARAHCRSLGGELASIPSADVGVRLAAVVKPLSRQSYFLGGTDQGVEGKWEWVDKTPFTYTNWNPGEPNDSGGEDYLHMLRETGKWNDISARMGDNGFICAIANGGSHSKHGWVKEGKGWCYYNNNKKHTGWLHNNDCWYYLNSGGAMETGWVHAGNQWYYMDGSGAMCKGWVCQGGKWYYMQNSGAMQTGWIASGGKWYYADQSGEMQTGWVCQGNKWYYLQNSGEMQTGWVFSGGKWFYMQSSGCMHTGWLSMNGRWYYMNNNGAMVTGSQNIGGRRYNFNSQGIWLG